MISRAKAGIELDRGPGTYTQITDPRGRVVAAIEKVQNSVTPQMAVDMVARYEAGASIREVAAAFKVHRESAVWSFARHWFELVRCPRARNLKNLPDEGIVLNRSHAPWLCGREEVRGVESECAKPPSTRISS